MKRAQVTADFVIQSVCFIVTYGCIVTSMIFKNCKQFKMRFSFKNIYGPYTVKVGCTFQIFELFYVVHLEQR